MSGTICTHEFYPHHKVIISTVRGRVCPEDAVAVFSDAIAHLDHHRACGLILDYSQAYTCFEAADIATINQLSASVVGDRRIPTVIVDPRNHRFALEYAAAVRRLGRPVGACLTSAEAIAWIDRICRADRMPLFHLNRLVIAAASLPLVHLDFLAEEVVAAVAQFQRDGGTRHPGAL